jgi:hypothetical protein
MSDERKVQTPTGFMEVRIELDPSISEDQLAFVRTFIAIRPEEGEYNTIPVRIATSQTIPLKPGVYRARAFLGDLSSEEVNVDIKAGQTRKITFFFGQES